jgi:hypothetical protein
MSEVRLNLIDSQHILIGTIHGSVVDACVAALSAEPETIAELGSALARFQKPLDSRSPFAWFHRSDTIDERPWDAGIVIIDLAARIVAYESTYSHPGPRGSVRYHDGSSETDISVVYQVPDDWIFLDEIEQYLCRHQERTELRAAIPPLDTRAILYGRPLLEFIVNAMGEAFISQPLNPPVDHSNDLSSAQLCEQSHHDQVMRETVSAIHARWLLTPREDLRGISPRDVLLAKQEFIDFDLDSREMQWSLLREEPPCLSTDSFAFRFGGYGTHEWVLYYDLVRHLLWNAMLPNIAINNKDQASHGADQVDAEIARLEQCKTDWLEQPQPEIDDIPAVYIEKERKRLPLAMSGRDMVVDETCPTCQMMAKDLEIGFCHLDGCNMENDFAFSHFKTRDEWEAEQRLWEDLANDHKTGDWSSG